MEEIKTIGRGAPCLNIPKNIPSDKTFVKSSLGSTCLNLNISLRDIRIETDTRYKGSCIDEQITALE